MKSLSTEKSARGGGFKARFASMGFPLSAIAGQHTMKTALILAGIDPGLGGVLLRGEKGTAKSTAARALAGLMPEMDVVRGCLVGCDPRGALCPQCLERGPDLPLGRKATPFVDLPVGVTEDKVTGSIDMSTAIKHGKLAFSPGLLAKAHRGVLYIDEVNLLPAHISGLVLDAAASGVNMVEREGISYRHPSSFTLIASYNPEEGPLSPQLLDRFGLCVQVKGELDHNTRILVLKRRLSYEQDPAAFVRKWRPREDDLRRRMEAARAGLHQIRVGFLARRAAAESAARAGSRGQRGELAMVLAARALAAWQGLEEVTPALVEEAAPLALNHRAVAAEADAPPEQARVSTGLPDDNEADAPRVVRVSHVADGPGQDGRQARDRTLYIIPPSSVKPIATRLPARDQGSMKQAGRRNARQVDGNRGRYLRASAQRLGRSVAFDATFRAAAPHQKARRSVGGPALVVRRPDIREKVRAAKRGRLLVLCVDASGSMNAASRMQETKAAILGLLTEAYQKRDRVGLVAFGGTSARVLLPPTGSVEVARRMLADLPTGGKTPLAAGMVAMAEIFQRELAQDPKLNPLGLIFTDGRPNVPLSAADLSAPAGNKGGGWGDGWGDGGYADREALNLAQSMAALTGPRYVVVDIDVGHHHEINLCRPLADYLGAPCVSLRKITSSQVLDLVKRHW